jgi:hypothetical protein
MNEPMLLGFSYLLTLLKMFCVVKKWRWQRWKKNYYIYIRVICKFLVRLRFYLYFPNNFCLPWPMHTIFLYVERFWVPHYRTKFQLISSYSRWVIRNVLRENVIFSWHVLRKANFSTVKRQEEKEILTLFCTAFKCLSEYIFDFNLISHSFLRSSFI